MAKHPTHKDRRRSWNQLSPKAKWNRMRQEGMTVCSSPMFGWLYFTGKTWRLLPSDCGNIYQAVEEAHKLKEQRRMPPLTPEEG